MTEFHKESIQILGVYITYIIYNTYILRTKRQNL